MELSNYLAKNDTLRKVGFEGETPSKNKQDNTFCQDFFVFYQAKRDILRWKQYPNLRSQSWDNIAQYHEIANQSNCAILGGSSVEW